MLFKVLLSFFSVASAIPTLPYVTPRNSNETSAFGFSFDSNSTGLPLLKLPYATYRAKTYQKDKDVSLIRLE